MRKRSRKRPEGYTAGLVISFLNTVLLIVLVCCVIFTGIYYFKTRQASESENETTAQETETTEESLTETSVTEPETSIVITIEETTTPAATEVPTTEVPTTEAPTEPPLLSDLSGYKPGDLIDMDRFDYDDLDKYFVLHDITVDDPVYNRINGKSYRKNDYVPLSSLTYITMPHYNFNGDLQMGEMIVAKDVAYDVVAIFQKLLRNKYQIKSMYLVDNYWTGDPDSTDSASIDVNNTSAFNYRTATGGSKLSNHAYGKAIDLNPQQNPYVSYSSGSPRWSHSNANDYIDRSTGLPHVITHDDLAYKTFTEYGFRWGGDWSSVKDYQHFDKN